MKKYIKVATSIFLAFLIMSQSIAITAFAVDEELVKTPNETIDTSEITNDIADMPDIVCEVDSKRSACKKDYLLEDGSFCSVITASPIHEYRDGRWIEKNKAAKAETIEQVVNALKTSNNSRIFESEQTNTRGNNNYSESNGLIIDWADNSYSVENGTLWHTLDGDETAFYVKPAQVGQYIENDYLVTSALFYMDCKIDANVGPNDPTPTAKSNLFGIEEWSEDYEDMYPDDSVLYSYRKIVEHTAYSYNITDLFNKWEKGVLENTGFAFTITNTNYFVKVSNPCLVVKYIDVDSAGLDFTYHSIDLDDSGTVYINDVTNNFKVKQKLIEYNHNKINFPVFRTYDSTATNLSNYSGIKSSFNFESKLMVSNNYAEWSMFDGNNVRFVPSDPPITNNGYEIWELLITPSTASINAALYLPLPESSGLNSCVMIDGVKYLFKNDGTIDEIIDNSSNSSIMDFEYTPSETGKIDYIEFQDGNTMVFLYDNSGFVSSIEMQNAIGQPILEDKKVELEYESINNQILNEVTFNNGDSTTYIFDSDGHMLNAINEEGLRCEFEYAERPNHSISSFIKGYKLFENDSNTASELLNIDADNTLKRVFTDINGKKESFYYNENYKIITYVGRDGKYKCLDYDEHGVLNSYVFHHSDLDTGLLLRPDFSRPNLRPWLTGGSNADIITRKNVTEIGGRCAFFSSTTRNGQTAKIYQDISTTENGPLAVFEADKTYVFGGLVYMDDVCPDMTKTVKITIETAPVVNGVPSTNYTEYSEIVFDNTLLYEWQFRRKAFKLEEDSVVRFIFSYNSQFGEVSFANPTLFESENEITDLDDMITSSPFEYTDTISGNSKISSETMIWERLNDTNLTMSAAYSYNQDGELCSYEDYNGNLTYYQYDSNGKISGKGHSIDGQNNITDVNSLAYNAENALLSTTQIIENVETNSNVTLSTAYEEESGIENGVTIKCVRITHNGYDQVYKYDTDGVLLETYAESTSLPSDFTNYNTSYQYDANKDIVQIDFSNGCRDVFYEIDDENDYISDDYICKAIGCYKVNGQTETLIKTYYYLFDESGELLISYDDGTEIRVDYSNNGYSLYDCSTSETPLIFTNEMSDGSGVQTYSNTYYSLTESGTPPTYTSPDTIEITPSSTSVDNDGVNTSVSTVTVEKNQGNHIMIAEYERTSAEDYFGRLSSKEITLEHETSDTLSGSMSLTEEYEYKDLGNRRTSGLVSGYVSTLSGSCEHPDENNNNALTVFNFSDTYARHYEYDNRGNLIFVYAEENNSIVAKEYYEYDDANQVITEINFDNEISAHYTYNAGGNLTAKIYYDFSDLVFNITNRSITSFGDEIDRITYQYDSVWKDRLINYDGVTITYDKMGNPLNYVGTNIEGASIIGTLEWHGNLLSAIEYSDNEKDYRIEYQYDRNGFRTFKALYRKRIVNNNVVYSNIYAIDYLWDNGVLIGIIFSGLNDSTGVREELLNVNFIYDEEGSISGYASYIGIPYLFKKDIHDNILSLVFPDGEEMFTYSYDSWGNATATYSSYWSSDPFRFIIVKAIAMLCPMAYHGYLYDYETGMCFNKGRCYSPDWGRNLNPEDYEKLIERPENPLEANLYLFCNNNPLNILDKTASWHREYTGVEWKANGFEVAMSDMFASRPLCTIFASQVIKEHGTWDATKGYSYIGLNAEDIACDLFAHYVGKYAKASINKVNAVWGDGWILNNSKSDKIFVYKEDPNLKNPNNPNEYGKYYKIWIAAPEIKVYAQKEGIFITL